METKSKKTNKQKKWFTITGVCLLVAGVIFSFADSIIGPEGTNGDYYVPFDQRTQTFRILQMWDGNPANDSLLVHNDENDYVRRIAPLNSFLANYATTSSLSGYTPNSRSLTINGVTQDLSANRTWTVGDLNSSGSYANPSWITSLAYSKLTGSPAFLTTETDPLFDTKFAGKTTTNLTEGANLYFTNARSRNAFSLTTTGTGAATYNSSTGVLNIPTPGTAKRQETYSGTTNASGQFTVTFGTAYSVAPNIQANIINGADNQNLRITAVSTTGFTVLARTRIDVIGLLPTWNNASGLGIDVLITEK